MTRGTHSALADERNAAIEVFINGDFFPRNEAKISVFDSAFLVGDGIWEGIRLHEGKLVFLDRHLDRLMAGLDAVGIEPGMARDQIASALYETIERNRMRTDVHVRLMITRGDKVTPAQHPDLSVSGPNVVIIAEHKVANPEIPRLGISLFTATVRRPPPDTLDQRLNTHSKLHEVMALLQAQRAGADEALMLDTTGSVATCNATNFFICTGEEVLTSTGDHCLPGITRGIVLELCEDHGPPPRRCAFGLEEVYGAEEAFVTGTFGGLTPVIEVDGRPIGEGKPGPRVSRLSALYLELIATDVSA